MIKLKDILEVSDYYKKQISRRKKFQRAYGESKTKGGKTINEIGREYGDLNDSTCAQIFAQEFIHRGNPGLNEYIYAVEDSSAWDVEGFAFKEESTNKEYEKLDGKPMSNKLKESILVMLQTKGCGRVHTGGGKEIIKYYHPGERAFTYHMFDFSARVKINRDDDGKFQSIVPTFYVGRIYTEPVEGDFKYSPSKQLNLKRVEQVHLSEIGTEWRGMGYGSYLYDVIANHVDALYSDNTLFEGSYKLWTKHMYNKANFFGAIIGNHDFILPIYQDIDSLNSDSIEEDLNGFVAIFKKVPPKLNELKQFLDGINTDEIGWSPWDPYTNNGMLMKMEQIPVNGIRDRIEKADSFKEFYKSVYGYEPRYASWGAYIVFHPQVTFVIKEVDDGLDYMLI